MYEQSTVRNAWLVRSVFDRGRSGIVGDCLPIALLMELTAGYISRKGVEKLWRCQGWVAGTANTQGLHTTRVIQRSVAADTDLYTADC